MFLILLLIVLPLPLVVYLAAPAGATPPQPWTDENWYMTSTSTSEAYNMGCTHGKYDATTGVSSLDILDFFGQNQSDTGTVIGFGQYPVTYAQIESLVENYALGYYVCTGGDTSTVDYIGVGTNDSAWSVTTAGGQAWGHVVTAVENYVIQTNLQSQVVVWAASDMEPGFNGPYGTATIDWVNGEGGTGNPLVNFGSADGCSTSTYNNEPCNNKWNQYDIWYISWGNEWALGDPEICVSAQSSQWTMIALYSYFDHGGDHEGYLAPLSEHALDSSCLTRTAAWDSFVNTLDQYPQSAETPPYATEMNDEPNT